MMYYVSTRYGADRENVLDAAFFQHFPNDEGWYELTDSQVVAAIRDIGRAAIYPHTSASYINKTVTIEHPAETWTCGSKTRHVPAWSETVQRTDTVHTPTGHMCLDFEGDYD